MSMSKLLGYELCANAGCAEDSPGLATGWSPEDFRGWTWEFIYLKSSQGYLILFYSSLEDMVIDFRDGGRRRETERNRDISAREKH